MTTEETKITTIKRNKSRERNSANKRIDTKEKEKTSIEDRHEDEDAGDAFAAPAAGCVGKLKFWFYFRAPRLCFLDPQICNSFRACPIWGQIQGELQLFLPLEEMTI